MVSLATVYEYIFNIKCVCGWRRDGLVGWILFGSIFGIRIDIKKLISKEAQLKSDDLSERLQMINGTRK